MSPYKSLAKHRKASRKGMRKRYVLEEFLKFENILVMNCLAVAEEKPLLVRAVGVNTDSRKKEGNWIIHLSRFAVNEKKFLEHLCDQHFPYEVKLGHFYLIKKASDEEVEIFQNDRTENLKTLYETIKKSEKRKGKK